MDHDLPPDDEIESQADSDPTLDFMRLSKMPLTREVWIEMSYPEGPPKPWTAELEAEVPEMFRRPS